MEIKNNYVHLCDSCISVYPECNALVDDVIFGDGFTNDNICCCNKYKPKAIQENQFEQMFERTGKDYRRPKVLYAIEDMSTGHIIFNANRGCYREREKAMKKLRTLDRNRYRIVEYVLRS